MKRKGLAVKYKLLQASITSLANDSTHSYPDARAPTPGIWLLGGWLSGLRVRECILCTYSYAGGRLADWLAHLRVRAYVRCRCRFTKVKRFSC